MSTPSPSSLDSSTLARRLRELAGEERRVQVDFLLHLDAFDRRRAFLELGYGSLWDYCLKALHLREGAAGRRIGAMRVLRRFPKLEAALRDGRLCLSTLALLGQVLTEENADELVARAAYRTKAEVDHLVASVQPRPAPKEGIRKLAEPSRAPKEMPFPVEGRPAELSSFTLSAGSERVAPMPTVTNDSGPFPPPAAAHPAPAASPHQVLRVPPTRTSEVRPVSEDLWSLRATIGSACKKDLDRLTELLSHKLTGADLAAVLHEAIRCGLEKHGKRKGAVEPARRREPKFKSDGDARAISAEVRRKVWQRDGGSCTWKAPDGRRCGSRWQLEIDHVRLPLLGGTSTPENLRLLCRGHNVLHAEEVYGREAMARFRRDDPAISGDSAGQ